MSHLHHRTIWIYKKSYVPFAPLYNLQKNCPGGPFL